MSSVHENKEAIRHTMKVAGAILRDAQIPYALAGGLAIWARGGPEVDHDVDFLVSAGVAEKALDAFTSNNWRTEHPPEGWLYKARDGDVVVDLIFDPRGATADKFISRADELEFYAVRMPVMKVEDVLITKLACLSEASLYFEGPLQIARSLREQVNWDYVRSELNGNPFADAFLVLLEDLGIIDSIDKS